MNIQNNHIYKVDKYNVPYEARDEFEARTAGIRQVLQHQNGFIQDFYLEQVAGPGSFNIVTIAEWESAKDIEKAKSAVSTYLKELNLNPGKMMKRLNIQADVGIYEELKAAKKQFTNEN